MGRVAPIMVLTIGLAIAALSMFLLTGMQADTGFADTAWRLAVLGVADAFMLSAVSVAAIQAVPQRLAGMAAAANTMLRQYGAALGPAVLGVIFAERLAAGASTTAALHTASSSRHRAHPVTAARSGRRSARRQRRGGRGPRSATTPHGRPEGPAGSGDGARRAPRELCGRGRRGAAGR